MSAGQLERECGVYCRYLCGQEPTRYVLDKYREFHDGFENAPNAGGPARFDRILVGLSLWGVWGARLADSYASRFAKGAVLRRKLVLTLALLECSAPSFEILDQPDAGAGIVLYGRLAFRTARFVLALSASTVMLAPIHLLASLAPGRSR